MGERGGKFSCREPAPRGVGGWGANVEKLFFIFSFFGHSAQIGFENSARVPLRLPPSLSLLREDAIRRVY